MVKQTELLPILTSRHGEGFYLVKSHEFEMREAQVYSIVAELDDQRQKNEDNMAKISELHGELNRLRVAHETVKGNLARLYELLDITVSRMHGLTARLEGDYGVLKTNIVRAIGQA